MKITPADQATMAAAYDDATRSNSMGCDDICYAVAAALRNEQAMDDEDAIIAADCYVMERIAELRKRAA